MGLTIHYRGRLNSLDEMPTIIEELSDIAKDMEWDITVVDKDLKLRECSCRIVCKTENIIL